MIKQRENPIISIIIPVYNVATYLSKCIDSILSQTFQQFEIILVDDGSTDTSGQLCDELKQKDSRIVVIHQENAGVSVARNNGLQVSRGKYIGFIDPDDWVERNMLESMLSTVKNNDCDAAFCGYFEDYSTFSITHSPTKIGVVDGREAFYQCIIDIGYGYFTSVWNKIFKREVIYDKNNKLIAFPEGCSIGEDEYWLALIKDNLKAVSLIREPLYHWKQRTGSALRKGRIDQRWQNALQTKQNIITLFEKDDFFIEVMKAKLYNDMFQTIWLSYCSNSIVDEKYFRNALQPYRINFWKSNNYSFKRKIKFLLIDLLCRINIKSSIVKKLALTTTLKLGKSMQDE